jgi:hypothetical protein
VDVSKKRKIDRPSKNLIEEISMAVTTEIMPNIYRVLVDCRIQRLVPEMP